MWIIIIFRNDGTAVKYCAPHPVDNGRRDEFCWLVDNLCVNLNFYFEIGNQMCSNVGRFVRMMMTGDVNSVETAEIWIVDIACSIRKGIDALIIIKMTNRAVTITNVDVGIL